MKNKMLICGAACFVLLCTPAKSQVADTALKNTYERETIMLVGDRGQYVKNNKRHRVKAFGQGLDKEFLNVSTETKKEFGRYREQRRRAVTFLTAGGTVMFASAILLPVAPVLLIPLAVGTGVYLVGGFSSGKSRRLLHKSLWLRNRDVLVKN